MEILLTTETLVELSNSLRVLFKGPSQVLTASARDFAILVIFKPMGEVCLVSLNF